MAGLRGREKRKIQSLGGLHEGKTTPWGYTPWGSPSPQRRPVKAGITSRANQRSCSLNSAGGMPSAQWIMH